MASHPPPCRDHGSGQEALLTAAHYPWRMRRAMVWQATRLDSTRLDSTRLDSTRHDLSRLDLSRLDSTWSRRSARLSRGPHASAVHPSSSRRSPSMATSLIPPRRVWSSWPTRKQRLVRPRSLKSPSLVTPHSSHTMSHSSRIIHRSSLSTQHSPCITHHVSLITYCLGQAKLSKGLEHAKGKTSITTSLSARLSTKGFSPGSNRVGSRLGSGVSKGRVASDATEAVLSL